MLHQSLAEQDISDWDCDTKVFSAMSAALQNKTKLTYLLSVSTLTRSLLYFDEILCNTPT